MFRRFEPEPPAYEVCERHTVPVGCTTIAFFIGKLTVVALQTTNLRMNARFSADVVIISKGSRQALEF